MSELVIRKAKEQDIIGIEEMYRKRVSYNDAHGIHQWDYDQVTWECFRQLYTINDYYVGFLDQTIVCGCFIVDVDHLYWPDEKAGAALYLHKIVVDPDYGGHGYADELIRFFKEKGKSEGYPEVRIDVREKKTKLRQMYERNGFQLVKIDQFVPEFTTALYHCTFQTPSK